MQHHRTRLFMFVIITIGLFASLGCEAVEEVGEGVNPAVWLPTESPENVSELAALPYPAAAPTRDVDIILERDGRHVRLTNRTARAYEDVQVWLTREYVDMVSAVAIGTGNRIPLSAFINRHGEPYPVGGFFSYDKNVAIVLAEIFDPTIEQRHRTVTRDKMFRR